MAIDHYTQEERQLIGDAWDALKLMVEGYPKCEQTLTSALAYEKHNCGTHLLAKAMIIKAILGCKSTRKEDLFTYSKGLADCVAMAWRLPCLFLISDQVDRFRTLAKRVNNI